VMVLKRPGDSEHSLQRVSDALYRRRY